MAVLFRLAVVLILIVGSVILAPGRGQMAGLMQITICAEGGPQTVTLDASGNPAPPHHPCPDCLPGLGAAPLPGTTGQPRMTMARPLCLPLPQDTASAGITAIRATARGPPLSV